MKSSCLHLLLLKETSILFKHSNCPSGMESQREKKNRVGFFSYNTIAIVVIKDRQFNCLIAISFVFRSNI